MKNDPLHAFRSSGGKARAASLTEKQRKAIASKAGNTPCSPGKSRGRPATRYRYLKAGEIIRKGDQWEAWHGGWIDCAKIRGVKVSSASANGNRYRRPITKTQKGI